MRKTLVLALAIAICGLVFSGYLTIREVIAGGGSATCAPPGEPGTMLGAPPCVYGFAIYAVIACLIAIAVFSRRLRANG